MKVCLVEDDLTLGRSLQAVLQDGGHEALWVRRVADARFWFDEQRPDAMLLDLGLPDGDGLDLLRHVRRHEPQMPVIVITARDGIEDRLQGLDSGADDYLVKPFVGPELLARLRAVARRAGLGGDADAGLWTARDLVLDEKRRRVTRAGEPVALSKTEFELLATLLKFTDRVLTRRELEVRALPGSDGHALDVHMANLRKKIGEGYIRTVRGVGYTVEP